MDSSRLIIVTAPSGAGKTTLCKKLLKNYPQLVLSVSSTTRPPRPGERHGVDYFFLSREEFESQLAAGEFAEWACVHGYYYGTSKAVIAEAFREKRSLLLEVDIQGAAALSAQYPNQCIRIFIAPPSLEHLEERLRARGTENEATLQKRLKNAEIELKERHHFDVVIVNDTLEEAYARFKQLVDPYLLSSGD